MTNKIFEIYKQFNMFFWQIAERNCEDVLAPEQCEAFKEQGLCDPEALCHSESVTGIGETVKKGLCDTFGLKSLATLCKSTCGLKQECLGGKISFRVSIHTIS